MLLCIVLVLCLVFLAKRRRRDATPGKLVQHAKDTIELTNVVAEGDDNGAATAGGSQQAHTKTPTMSSEAGNDAMYETVATTTTKTGGGRGTDEDEMYEHAGTPTGGADATPNAETTAGDTVRD